jgi:hypothetical protein
MRSTTVEAHHIVSAMARIVQVRTNCARRDSATAVRIANRVIETAERIRRCGEDTQSEQCSNIIDSVRA